jgi:pimeloyl-ACP methyl ester carboxylesterase
VNHVRANGIDFAYLSEGDADKPLVVLLHGFPDTASTWDRSMAALANAGYRAVAPFMRGYAPSSLAADGRYDSDTLGRDALGLIDALGGGKPAILVGHDWGASAAYSAASQGPDRVRLLITLAIPHPRSMKPTPALVWKLRHFATLRRKSAPAKLRATNFAYVDELWHRWSPSWREIPASETEAVKASLREPGSAEAACAYYAAIGLGLPESHKQRITVPTVSFAGLHDMVAPRAYEKARHCFTASYEVVQVPGGHFMHRQHPDEFNRELVRVVTDHDAR